MGFLSILLCTIGLGIGFVFGICLGFYFFIYSDPETETFQDPVVKPISELDLASLQDLMPEIPLWLKNPDYDPVDWLNKFLLNMWPYLDKVHCKKPKKENINFYNICSILGRKSLKAIQFQAICDAIKQTIEPIISDYIGHGHRHIKAITFETLSLGTLPPIFQGVKVCETDENQLVMEPAIKWAGNPNIVMVVQVSAFRIKIQLVDLQVFVVPRVVKKRGSTHW
ncbi:synaptotagmin-3-like [Bidens hawaiensis]|uniref:synaptotagmin-3-like n=1 Tax=Bidens hawaiensis TaxID=980011 RepID=UPI0040495D89